MEGKDREDMLERGWKRYRQRDGRNGISIEER
jgi:hypothetical protein